VVRLRDLTELVRAPAALTVPGDCLAGAAAAGWPLGRRTPLLAAAPVSLYWAGMALNDYADRAVDAVERPHRPVPSGRVPAGVALGMAAGLTAAGLGIGWLAGGRRAVAALAPLTAAVWAYDLGLKNTRAGPAAMAAARGLDVLVGAAGAGRPWPALPAAASIAGHTYAVTVLSRCEVAGASRTLPLRTLAGTVAVAAATLLVRGRRTTPVDTALVTAALAGYLARFGRAQLAAARDPAPARVRQAVTAGIGGMLPLQAANLAAAGAPGGALAVAAGIPVTTRLFRRVTPT
jgi:4-hydroxybenzoate polyprenyltransferase